MISQYTDLKNTVVFITGGGSGIGAALVRAFASQGAKVAFVSIQKEHCVQIEEINPQQEPLFIQCDIRDISALKKAIREVEDTLGDVDVLINNAADDKRHSIENYSVDDWDNSLNTNLRPHFFSAQAVLSGMKKKKKGSIINLGSNSALLGLPDYPSYVAAKAGIIGLTKALAREIGRHNIRVNALIPGWVMTDKQKRDWATPEAIKECLRSQSLKTLITETDIAHAALFLASDASSMMTGQSLIVDGGRV
ncbi:SDR family NAD(P)-dependent oxidoreductase [Agarilytica rhodophyticola]|uniref:SDR family NAD(P)-dependent oxidoreductase n=1 Tax=Agarilytica rhodophyticola TaxID=1737490 RepID=UPI000B346DA7|nr:SDR family oxidoreductase [Agarilytica rhodophyticola]